MAKFLKKLSGFKIAIKRLCLLQKYLKTERDSRKSKSWENEYIFKNVKENVNIIKEFGEKFIFSKISSQQRLGYMVG